MPNLSAPYLEWYNGTTIIEFFRYPNVVTNNLFWPLMLLVFGFILFGSFRIFGSKPEEAFAITSFILMPISFLGTVLGFIDPSVSLIPIILSMFGVLIIYRKDGN